MAHQNQIIKALNSRKNVNQELIDSWIEDIKAGNHYDWRYHNRTYCGCIRKFGEFGIPTLVCLLANGHKGMHSDIDGGISFRRRK